jgi:hypothetical protein
VFDGSESDSIMVDHLTSLHNIVTGYGPFDEGGQVADVAKLVVGGLDNPVLCETLAIRQSP